MWKTFVSLLFATSVNPWGIDEFCCIGVCHEPAQELRPDRRKGVPFPMVQGVVCCRRMHENASLGLSQRSIKALLREFNQAIEAFLLERARGNHV
jgi:hypothetical protein